MIDDEYAQLFGSFSGADAKSTGLEMDINGNFNDTLQQLAKKRDDRQDNL